jgi:carboxymethylenebutenolidase
MEGCEMKLINRDLSSDKDGIPGYLAHPDRKEPGPGVMIVHHHYGVTGNMKVKVCDYAKLGYTTVVPDLYKMLGAADGVHEAQKNTTDGQFVEILTQSWRYLTSRPEVDAKRCAVVGYCMGGRIGIHFVAATPSVRAFVGYYRQYATKSRTNCDRAIPTTRSKTSSVRRRYFLAAKTTSPRFRCSKN